jgi:hypothetical protein
VNRPALIVGAVLLVALAAVTAVGEYVRWHLPRGDEKLTACRAIPPGSSLTAVVGVLGQPTMRQAADLAEGAVWLEFSTPTVAPGRIRAAVHEPSGKVLALRCSADGPDTWAAPD